MFLTDISVIQPVSRYEEATKRLVEYMLYSDEKDDIRDDNNGDSSPCRNDLQGER